MRRRDFIAQQHPNRPGPLGILKLVAALAVLLVLPTSASTPILADEEGRIQITFSKPDGSGSGYLFYQGQKYSLGVSGAKIGRMWATSIDLIGTASNLRSAADILGTYNGTNPEAALVRRAATARLENAKGVVLEIRAVNLNRWSTLDLSGMILKNRNSNTSRIMATSAKARSGHYTRTARCPLSGVKRTLVLFSGSPFLTPFQTSAGLIHDHNAY